MWIFAVAALMPEYMETFALVVPPVVILILFALPFFNNTGEKSWRRRPIAMLTVVLTYLVMGILTYLDIPRHGRRNGRMERCSH
jgi:ubiquinol-cytochrome c reductase cytochrome b subunit